MLHKMFSIYDTKAEVYSLPQMFQSAGVAIRSFTDAVNTPDTSFAMHPEDYTLFEIGEFDDQNTSIKMLKTPHSLAIGIELVKNNRPLVPTSPKD